MMDIVARWRSAPKPAPETVPLRRLRMASMVSCFLAALLIAILDLLLMVDRVMVFVPVVVAITAAVLTVTYWRRKARIDAAFAEAAALPAHQVGPLLIDHEAELPVRQVEANR